MKKAPGVRDGEVHFVNQTEKYVGKTYLFMVFAK